MITTTKLLGTGALAITLEALPCATLLSQVAACTADAPAVDTPAHIAERDAAAAGDARDSAARTPDAALEPLDGAVSGDGGIGGRRVIVSCKPPATEPGDELLLSAESLRNEHEVRRLEGVSKTGTATWELAANGSVTAGGALAWALPLGGLDTVTLSTRLKVKLPMQALDDSSVSLAFYNQGTDERRYALLNIKPPGRELGEATLGVEGLNAVDVVVTPGASYWLDATITAGTLELRLWREGEQQPAAPTFTAAIAGSGFDALGVRTYASTFVVEHLEAQGTRGAGPVLDTRRMPMPIFDGETDLLDLYWKAWSLAFAHVKHQAGVPQSPYMDEAFDERLIWIWDTAFMALFSKYAPDQFPGVESLLNFYAPAHDGAATAMKIRHPDNPPLFAWVEWENYKFSGDKARLRWLLEEKQYLQKHYAWFQGATRFSLVPWAEEIVWLSPDPLGFRWSGVASGMDNSPRFREWTDPLSWTKEPLAVDALAQQGLSAQYISLLAAEIGADVLATDYRREFERVEALINDHYWDDSDGFYYDLTSDTHAFTRTRTPASFWPVLAGMASREKVERMTARLLDPNDLGGDPPWVSVSRSDPSYVAEGGLYWRGAVWLPIVYMGTRALAQNGQREVADDRAESVVRHMAATYRAVEPHTIWEAYHPTRTEPATHDKGRVRPDFCGWSALGPIALFIENVLGIDGVDASRRRVEWHLHQDRRHGLRNLRFGELDVDLLAEADGSLHIAGNEPFTLVVNGEELSVDPCAAQP